MNTSLLNSINHSIIARHFDETIQILGEDFDKDSILLFISDAAPYMIKATKAIKIFYPKIKHMTCLIHGLHRIIKHIRDLHNNVDKLMANIKIVTAIMNIITSVNDTAANPIKEKLSTVIDKNDGFKTLQNISTCRTRYKSKYTICEILAFKFAPITSVGVERSFTM